jgi:nitroreductase
LTIWRSFTSGIYRTIDMTATTRTTEHAIAPLFTDRWSSRAFSGERMDEATLLSLLEAARWAPSASNTQPWRFVYALADTAAWQPIFGSLMAFNQGWAAPAAALVVVLSKQTTVAPGKTEAGPAPWHAFDAGAAWASLAFQAHLSGWVTHAMGGFDADALRAALNVPADVSIHAVVAVGKRGDKASLPEPLQAREVPNGRLPLAQIATAGSYTFEG